MFQTTYSVVIFRMEILAFLFTEVWVVVQLVDILKFV